MLGVRICALALAVLDGNIAFAQGLVAPPTSTPASATSRAGQVPQATLSELESLFVPPPGLVSPQEAVTLLTSRMEQVLTRGRCVERDYPMADNLTHVRLMMLQAADFLARTKKTAQARQEELEITQRILSSDAALEEKLQADFIRTMLTIRPTEENPPVKGASGEVKAFIDRYGKSRSAATAYAYATMLAIKAKDDNLRNEYIKVLRDKYLDAPGVRPFLKQLGAYSEVGRTFEAKLTQLDGKTLTLPDDLRGKIVVVDFWATWCPPCVAAVPHMKELYQKYKDRGVEFVGISADSDRKPLEEFVKDRQIPWIQTYSGRPIDPTAQKYGVSQLPTLFVMDRDGKIVNDDADERLEEIITRLLNKGTTVQSQPASATSDRK